MERTLASMNFLVQTPEPTDQQWRTLQLFRTLLSEASLSFPCLLCKWETSLWSSVDPLGEKTLFCGMFTVAQAVSQ